MSYIIANNPSKYVVDSFPQCSETALLPARRKQTNKKKSNIVRSKMVIHQPHKHEELLGLKKSHWGCCGKGKGGGLERIEQVVDIVSINGTLLNSELAAEYNGKFLLIAPSSLSRLFLHSLLFRNYNCIALASLATE